MLVGAQFYAFNPFLTFLLKAMGVIRVDEVTGNMDAVNKAVEVLSKGHDILIFPEGHIETEGKLQFFIRSAIYAFQKSTPVKFSIEGMRMTTKTYCKDMCTKDIEEGSFDIDVKGRSVKVFSYVLADKKVTEENETPDIDTGA